MTLASKLRISFLSLTLSWLVVAAGCSVSAASSERAKSESVIDTAYLASFEFLRRADNRIEAPDSLLRPLFEHLERLEKRRSDTVSYSDSLVDKLSILHIGDSHIQAGIFTQQVRGMMQRMFGNGGRGLITPLKLAHTNEPQDYSILSSAEWECAKCTDREPLFQPGMTGLSIRSKDNDFDILIREYPNPERPDYSFCTVTAYHSPSAPPIECDDTLTVGMGCPDTSKLWCSRVDLTECVDSIRLRPSREKGFDNPEYWGFSLENDESGVIYHSTGINGACYLHYSRLGERLKCLSDLTPELIIISMGTNESSTATFHEEQFTKQIDGMVTMIKAANPDAVIMLTTPVQNFRRSGRGHIPNTNTVKARNTIAAYARQNGLALWDMFEVCGGEDAAVAWNKATLMARDKIHYNEKGYKLKGMLLFEALLNSYEKYKAQREQ